MKNIALWTTNPPGVS